MSHQSIYKITTTENGYTFTTDLGLEYQAYFIEGGYMLPIPGVLEHVKVFGFNVADTNLKFRRDCKVKNTIFYILKEVITENPMTVITFTCDSSDCFDRHRKIVFSQWYCSSPEKDKYVKLDKTIEGVHGSIIFRQDHPFKQTIYDTMPELEDLIMEGK